MARPASPSASEPVHVRPTDRTGGWIRELTPDAIRHFAWGVGDDNPLWLDAAYAASGPAQGLVAPPCILYAVDSTEPAQHSGTTPGEYIGVSWRWYDRARENLRPVVDGERVDVQDGDGRVVQTGEFRYRDLDGRLVAVARSRVAYDSPSRSGTTAPDDRRVYALDALDRIEEAILAERPRGRTPRIWEGVSDGDRVEPVVKGPLSIIDNVAWSAGACGAPAPGNDDDHAIPSVAAGQQRVAWSQHMLTHWIGDHGFLCRLDVELLRATVLGDTTTWTGSIAGTQRVGPVGTVRLDLESRDQDEQITARGSAWAILPDASLDPLPLPLPTTFDVEAGRWAEP